MKRWILALTALALACSLAGMGTPVGLAQSNLARLRLVQAAPNAPPLDALINGNTIFAGLEFKAITPYVLVTPGVSSVQLVPAGPNPAPVVSANANLAACTDYTLVAVGLPGSTEPLLLLDDNSPPAPGQARLRFVHASPNAPAVDIALANGPVLFSNVQFKGVAGYASVSAGTYTVEVRQAGTSNVLLTLPNVTLDNCTVSTLWAVGLLGGSPPLEVISSLDAITACVAPAATAVAPAAATRTPIPAVPPVMSPTTLPVATATPSGTPLATASPTPTATATGTLTPTLTATPTETPTATPSPSPSPSPSPTMKATVQPTETAAAAPTATRRPTKAATAVVVPPTAPPAGKTPPMEATALPGGGMGPSQGGLVMPTPWWKANSGDPW